MDSNFDLAVNLLKKCFNLPSNINASSLIIDLDKKTCNIVNNGKNTTYELEKNKPVEYSVTSEMDTVENDYFPSDTSSIMFSSKEKIIKPFKMNERSDSATSDMNETVGSMVPSTTSEEEPREKNKQKGGKNIFKTLKYSDTSSVMYSELSKYSITSANTFVASKNNFSETSPMEQLGGKVESDTLNSISELGERKLNSKKSDLNVDIFKRSQKGGSSNKNILKKIAELGINSSSTSSVCE
jgi:hypothetical protein